MVEEGDKVSEGQTLAALDQEDIAALEEKVIQAKVTLTGRGGGARRLHDALPNSTLPARERMSPTPRSGCESAQDALDDSRRTVFRRHIRAPRPRIVSYQVDLDKIAEDIESLQEPPTRLEIDQAEKNVASARLELERARDKPGRRSKRLPPGLRQTRPKRTSPARGWNSNAPRKVWKKPRLATRTRFENARNNVDSAERELAYSEDELDVVQREWEVRLTDARDDLEDKAEAYAKVFAKWLGVKRGIHVIRPRL